MRRIRKSTWVPVIIDRMNIDNFTNHSATVLMPLIREIFFLSADPRNVSEDPVKNEAFFEKWTGYYFKYCPEWILLAWKDHKLLGYIMCETDSARALPYYESRNPTYSLFKDQFDEYPAHLHMNSHPEARNQGVGAAMVAELVRRLKAEKVGGVHLITSPAQRNVGFYRKNDFDFELQREWRGFPLLFMGRKISF